MVKRLIGLALLASWLIGIDAVHAAEPAAAAHMVAPGKLTYAVNSAFPPFEFLRDGTLTGFDIDMAALIAARLALEPTPLMMSFDGMLPALQGGRVDIVNSGMYINAKRQEQAFLVPYMRIGQEIVVHKGNPTGITGRADLCGKRVAVATGSIMETNAHQDSDRCTAAGRPALEIMNFPDGNSVVALRQGRADAYYAATPAAAVLVSQFPNDFERAGPTFEANTELGIAIAHDRADLKLAVEQALTALRADGSLARVAQKYDIPETALNGL